MKPCKKFFLLTVGIISIVFDEVSKSIEEAAQSIDKNRKNIHQHVSQAQVHIKFDRR